MSLITPPLTDPKKATDRLEIKPKSIIVKNGHTAFYDGNLFILDGNHGIGYAEGDNIIVAKCLPAHEAIQAYGSPCRVIAFYNPSLKLGALIHIAIEDIASARHKTLIDDLLTAFPKLQSRNTKVIICGDAVDITGDTQSSGITYEHYHAAIAQYISSKGIRNIEICSNRVGKDVSLYTATGKIVIRDNDEFIIKQGLMK